MSHIFTYKEFFCHAREKFFFFLNRKFMASINALNSFFYDNQWQNLFVFSRWFILFLSTPRKTWTCKNTLHYKWKNWIHTLHCTDLHVAHNLYFQKYKQGQSFYNSWVGKIRKILSSVKTVKLWGFKCLGNK